VIKVASARPQDRHRQHGKQLGHVEALAWLRAAKCVAEAVALAGPEL
jgi:hypothetical protein